MTAPVIRALAAPLQPSPDDARERLRQELADPVYDAAEPTLIDRAAQAVAEFFARLLNPDLSGGWGPTVAVIATVVVVALLVAALLVWGRPRAAARSHRATGELFGHGDDRSAAQLRAEADARAAAEQWPDAIVLRFRALARGLAERAVVEPPPGTTAQAFARDAARAFPAAATDLASAATGFDDVRYLRRPGARALYDEIARLDDALANARPAMAEAPR